MKKFINGLWTKCSDGWDSPSTGQGTCSHHGGIATFQSDDAGIFIGIFIAIFIAILIIFAFFKYIKNSSNKDDDINKHYENNKDNEIEEDFVLPRASKKQIKFMKEKNIEFHKDITKKEAQKKIEDYLKNHH